MNPLMSKLVATELYLQRWMIVAGLTAGILSQLISAAGGKTAFSISMIAWLTTVISFGVMLPMLTILRDRQKRSVLFLLSLPLSPQDYVRARLYGVGACYLIFWLVMTLSAVTMVLISPIPDGGLPATILLCVFLLMNFCIVLACSFHARTEGPLIAVIIVTNMSVSLFFMLVGGIPGLGDRREAAVAVWNAGFWTVLAALLAVMAIALATPLIFAGRRRDFI